MSNTLTVSGNPYVAGYLPLQLELLFSGHTEQFNVIPKGRRWGVTHCFGKFSIDQLLEGKSILWVDTVQSNLDAYFNLYFLPELKQFNPKYWRYRQVQKDLVIASTRMDFRSAERPENIEGFAYHIIIINEAGIVLKGQRGRNLWFNTLYPMVLDYGADVYFIGTPKGKKAKKDEAPCKVSLYYELALKGGLKDKGVGGYSEEDVEELLKTERDLPSDITIEALEDKYKKLPKWRTHTYSSYQNPLLDAQGIKELEEDVPRAVRKQEIHGQFIDLGDEEIFKQAWFVNKIKYELPADHLLGRKIMSADTAFKKGAENDDSAIGVFQEAWIDRLQVWFWIDLFVGKLEFPELLEKMKKMHTLHNPDLCLVEDKASGTSLIQMLRRQAGFPITAVNPDTDKVSRAVACTPWFSNGQIYLLFGGWNQIAIDQLCDFNALLDTPDDIVDMISQFLNFIKGGGIPLAPPISKPHKDRQSKQLDGYFKTPVTTSKSGIRKSNYLKGYF